MLSQISALYGQKFVSKPAAGPARRLFGSLRWPDDQGKPLAYQGTGRGRSNSVISSGANLLVCIGIWAFQSANPRIVFHVTFNPIDSGEK